MRKRIKASFYNNHFEPRAKEEQNHAKSRVGEKGSYRVIKNFEPSAEEGHGINLSEISNLVRKRGEESFRILYRRKEVIDHQKL